jgi:hypothetical protein
MQSDERISVCRPAKALDWRARHGAPANAKAG